jgi:hypothetical protein
MKILMLAAAISLGIAGAATAQTPTQPKMVLELRPGMCPPTNDLVMYWAKRSKGIASFAAATARILPIGDCRTWPKAKIGYSTGATTRAEADSMALRNCVALNAGNAVLGRCIVVGRLRPAAAN